MSNQLDTLGVAAPLDPTPYLEPWRELLSTAVELRTRLGAQAYLLDLYLDALLQSLSSLTWANYRLEHLSDLSALRLLCRSILENDTQGCADHPLYPQARAYIEAHPLPYDRATACGLYCLALYDEFFTHSLSQCHVAQQQELGRHRQAILAPALYGQLAQALPPGTLDHLAGLACRALLPQPPAAHFAQGCCHSLLHLLTTPGAGTKRLFSLYLDALQPAPLAAPD